jgi:hypothetical protein
MKIEPKANCPLDGFKPCRQLECAWFMKINGKDPQTGKEVDEWGCSMAWLPVLLIETNRVNYQTGAAVESFRNEMVKANETSQHILLAASKVSEKSIVIEANKCD